MKLTREQKKAKMMARLAKAVEELLDWEEKNERPNLTQIEDIVLKLRKEVGEEMANEILAEIGGKTPVPGPACPKCGKEMRYKGQQGAWTQREADDPGEYIIERLLGLAHVAQVFRLERTVAQQLPRENPRDCVWIDQSTTPEGQPCSLAGFDPSILGDRERASLSTRVTLREDATWLRWDRPAKTWRS